MNYKYNEYLRLAKQRLNNINLYEKALCNLNESLQDVEKNLDDEAVAIAKYEEMTGRAFTELTPTERAAQERMKLEAEQDEMKRKQKRIQYQLKTLLRSIDLLDDSEKQAAKMFYFDKNTFSQIGEAIGCSERTARRRVNSATQHIAFILFGDVVEEDIEFVNYSVMPITHRQM